MITEVVTGCEKLTGLRVQWDELARSDRRDGFFLTSTWYLAWMRHVQPHAQPFVIVVRDDDGEIIGLAPLCKMPYRDHGLRLTSVSSAGREVVSGDFLDYLSVQNRRDEVLTAILDFLWQMKNEWEILVVGEVSEGGDLHRSVESFAQAHGLSLRCQEERSCPYIELPATFEEYLRNLSPKMRYEIRRDTREVLEKHGARIEVHTDPTQVSQNLDVLIQLHLSHWQRVNEPGTLGRPGFSDFLKEVCTSQSTGASTRLYILKHEEKPAAALLAFWFGDNALFYQTGWDPDSPIARMSPGMVLISRAIRDAIEHPLRYFDFLRGDEPYKSRLTKLSRKTVTLLVARSFLAKEYLRVGSLKDSVKRLIGAAAEPNS